MSERSCRFTTFKSILGFYAFSVLAFGLANAPEVFQRFVSSILAEFSGFARCYLDDVLIISDSVEEHAVHLEKVLSRLKEHQLHLNLEKSVFFEEKEFKWLGHRFVIDAASGAISIHPSDRTINIIKQFPRPSSKLELQQYLGHINYVGSFIPKLSIICSPFQPLLAKNARFHWTDACESAFQTLKDLELDIMSKQSFAPGKPITIVVDASDYAVGCALLQPNSVGELVPVEFRSTTLTGFQTRWSTTEKELYALKFAVEKFAYFMTASSEIRVETDHKALSDIFNSAQPTAKQVRWINFIIDGHSIKVDHVPGSTNQLADYLSRYRPASTAESTKPSLDVLSFHQLTQSASELTIDDDFSTRLAAAYQACPAYSKIISSIGDYPDYHLSDGLLYFQQNRLVIPEALIEDLLLFYHTSVFGGHAGGNKLYTWLKKHYYFTSMSRVIKAYVAQCVVCQRAKSTNRAFGHLQATTPPSGRWTNISMDVVSGFNDVSMAGSIVNAILVLVDNLSHRCHLFPVNKSLNSQEFSDLMVQRYMPLHGLPQVIHSDLDSTFTSSYTKHVLSAFKIEQQMSVTDHHQSNGIAERKIRTVQEYLRLFIDSENPDWVSFLSYAEFCLNSTPSVASIVAQLSIMAI
ncbi:hypothetical protein WICPIJ_002619 [Wickerhamomyces pijperi]|uniref:Uncharacterized protein n=1 Tax=Wickerhamomyces pijperi TaxID=599730 RepID=A0A9P8QBK6_WICPI|nr:hypothetical protein WICPIJ_002619 [Wickerhamomyces pijperi]